VALIVSNRVQETTTSTGSGPFTVGNSVAGYQSFNSGIGNANTTYYTIIGESGWMDVIGTYTTPNTLSVDAVLSSSAANNALVSFSAGSKTVFCDYSAPTALSGGGGGTYPAIKPSLNLDFANSKTVDPRITFVRATTATYYDGKTTAMAEQNLLLQSNTFSDAAWVATNGTVASGVTDPAGTTTAFSFTATGVATLYQTLTTTATPYTLSFYIQRVTGTGAVNLTLDGTTLTPQTITGSWARYSVTATPTAASHTMGLQLAISGDVVNIFIAQLENRSSMTTVNITTTAAITNYIPVLMTAPAGVPRLDYNPVTGQALGLLIEEQRTNLLTYSATFSNAIWTLTNATLIAAANVAPDGTQTAFNLASNTATGLQAIAQTVTKAASAIAYTSTIYFKANQYTYSWLQISDGAGNGAIVYFNLTTGAISTAVAGIGTAFTALSATITSVGDGWYRCNITGTSNTATSLVTQFGSSTNGTSNSVVGNGYNGVYVWGASSEQGSFATSYIPTTSAQVTRNADIANMTGTNFSSWYNQSQGTLYIETIKIGQTTNSLNYAMIGTSPVGQAFRDNGGELRWQRRGGLIGTSDVTLSPTLSVGVLTKMAASFVNSTTGVSTGAVVNGGSVTSYSTYPFATPETIFAFYDGGGTALSAYYIKRALYYPQALTSANLVALTS